ncbi:MAG: outer membrane lipoprotein-sorting protein [Gammaproteobacteria bacterium]|nr:outer membrane lipoprotein-sorting protein [Gammaproteobacteria bacterium]
MIESLLKMVFNGLFISMILLVCGGTQASTQVYKNAKNLTDQCHYRGEDYDQRSIMTVLNRNRGGMEKKSEYLRLLRYYGMSAQIKEKMLLLTEYPPDAKGVAFLRWEYALSARREVDQWLYMPNRKVLRRISARNDNDSFLGSVLTLGDIKERPFDADQHAIIKTQQFKEGIIYTLESSPKNKGEQYSKLLKKYRQSFSTGKCELEEIIYYDQKKQMLKKQSLVWQYIDGIPIWKHVAIENLQSRQSSEFSVDRVEMNVGIKDTVFSKRTMRRGLK